MLKPRVLWNEKPSKKHAIYYSFLYRGERGAGGLGPLYGSIIILVCLIMPVLIYFYYPEDKVASFAPLVISFIFILVLLPFFLSNMSYQRFTQYIIDEKGVIVKKKGSPDSKVLFSNIIDFKISQDTIVQRIIGIYDIEFYTRISKTSWKERKPALSFLSLDDISIPKSIIEQKIKKVFSA